MELQVTGGSELCFAGGAGQGPGSVHLLVVLLQQLRGLEVGLLVKIGYVVLALHHGAEEGGRERRHGRRLFEKNILTDYSQRYFKYFSIEFQNSLYCCLASGGDPRKA